MAIYQSQSAPNTMNSKWYFTKAHGRWGFLLLALASLAIGCKSRTLNAEIKTPQVQDRPQTSETCRRVDFSRFKKIWLEAHQTATAAIQAGWERDGRAKKAAYSDACAKVIAAGLVITMTNAPALVDSLGPAPKIDYADTTTACTVRPVEADNAFREIDRFFTQYNPDPDAKSHCELPYNQIFPEVPQIDGQSDLVKARFMVARALLGSLFNYVQYVNEPRLAEASRYLAHYLNGSGKPIEITDPDTIKIIAKYVHREWVAKNKPEYFEYLFSVYLTENNIGDGDGKRDLVNKIPNTLGRAVVAVRLMNVDGEQALRLDINDKYVWPYYPAIWDAAANKQVGTDLVTAWNVVPRVMSTALKFIIQDNEEFLIHDGAVSDGFWGALDRVGAKPFNMVLRTTVKVKDIVPLPERKL